MSKLYLYSLFHANLSFSSIPKKKYPNVIDKCYWPMLELVRDGHKIGFEFPAATLKIIEDIDGSFVRELAYLWDKGYCEVVGSGLNQNIFPLIPYEVNAANLREGMKEYERILGKRPKLAFVNEQTYSAGLPKLYADAGFEAIMMDWDNASEYHNYPPELRYRPAIVEGVDGTLIPVVWNSSLNSYKFQRCIYNRMSIDEYIEEVVVHYSFDSDRSIILYGTDVEMFNYRPILQEENDSDIKKIGSVFSKLKSLSNIRFITPSEVLNYFAATEKVRIETPESPIPCKNRDDYNVLRWAVSGRDDVWFNTECYKIYNRINEIRALGNEESVDENIRQLNILWGSDLRTKTTNDKFYEGKKKIGELSGHLDKELETLFEKIEVKKDFVLFNPLPVRWENAPYETDFHFAEGLFFEPPFVKLGGDLIPMQVEDITRYRDGSIRTLKLLLLPDLSPYEVKDGEFIKAYDNSAGRPEFKYDGRFVRIKTGAVDMKLAGITGGDIRELVFNGIFGSSLISYLSPLYYDHVGHSNDYYSMGVKVFLPGKGVVNDTKPTSFSYDKRMLCAPVRIPISCKVAFEAGIVVKTYYVYRNIPRVDLKYSFYLDNISPEAFRLGILTLNPQAFSKHYLNFSTVNGSGNVEKFYVEGRRIAHNKSVGPMASGSCCLGATEGWINISDNDKGIAVITDKSELYSVGMIEYEEIKERYLMRLYNSISESDETGKIFWRGDSSIRFTLLGHKNDISYVRRVASYINNDLVCIYKKNKGKILFRDTGSEREAVSK